MQDASVRMASVRYHLDVALMGHSFSLPAALVMRMIVRMRKLVSG